NVEVTTTASRPGTDVYNARLAAKRAETVRTILLKDFGLKPDCVTINATGEEDARERGKPDGKDDRADRVALITIVARQSDNLAAKPDANAAKKYILESPHFARPG